MNQYEVFFREPGIHTLVVKADRVYISKEGLFFQDKEKKWLFSTYVTHEVLAPDIWYSVKRIG